MTAQVKICGISSATDYHICREAGARWVGMVHYPGSPRHLDVAKLAELAACADIAGPNDPLRVLLSVNIIGDQLMQLIEAARPDILQLHGTESQQDVADIKARTGLPVIKAIAIETPQDLDQCAKWDDLADWLLFDAKVQPGSQPGGTGHRFDWTILAGYRGRLPWMLAGGLDRHTVASAVKISGAKAVDVSSGVESSPAKKDAEQIHAFIRAAQMV